MTAKQTKCATVAIVGRPNVGKSTLLNAILGEKVSIVSNVPQTTRSQIRGIYTDERGQLIFIDTPGMHVGRDGLDKFMNRASTGSIADVDIIIHLVDTNDRIGTEEKRVVDALVKCGKTIIVGLNKVDVAKGKFIPDYIKLWESARGKPITEMPDLVLFPLSALVGTNVRKLLDLIFEQAPEGPMLYPPDVITDFPQRLAVADLVREQLFLTMREEIPHSIAVVVESMEQKKPKVVHIKAAIMVERPTQKEIVIGKGGEMLKKIGMAARKELEDLLENKVYLELFVKVESDWRDNYSTLEEMGYIFE